MVIATKFPIFSPCGLDSHVESYAGPAIPNSSISKVHFDSSDWFRNGIMIQVYPIIINPRHLSQLRRNLLYVDALAL